MTSRSALAARGFQCVAASAPRARFARAGRGEVLGFRAPVVGHAFRADDEAGAARVVRLRAQPEQPGEGLDGFAEAHVVGEDAAETVGAEVGEEVEAFALIRAQIGR